MVFSLAAPHRVAVQGCFGALGLRTPHEKAETFTETLFNFIPRIYIYACMHVCKGTSIYIYIHICVYICIYICGLFFWGTLQVFSLP